MKPRLELSGHPGTADELDGILIPLYILDRATREPVVSASLTRDLIDRGVRCDSDSVAQIMQGQHRNGYLSDAQGHNPGAATGAFRATDLGCDEARRLLEVLVTYCS